MLSDVSRCDAALAPRNGVEGVLERCGMSQTQAAKRHGVTQSRVSDLMRGKINLFALDALVSMAVAAGLHVEMRIIEPA